MPTLHPHTMAPFDCIKGHKTTVSLNEEGFCMSCICLTCQKGDFERSLKCFTCKKINHFKCTQLNPWYLLDYTETGSKYRCTNCTKAHAEKILIDGNKKSREEIQVMLKDIEEYLKEKCTTSQLSPQATASSTSPHHPPPPLSPPYASPNTLNPTQLSPFPSPFPSPISQCIPQHYCR